jgi:ion channel-forming bestrophin family protein
VHAGCLYTLREIAVWTRRETLLFAVLASLPTGLLSLGVHIPSLPWTPVAVLGTAVAFLTGFKGNAAYNRLWEARQIWGGIVNTSRTWGMLVRDFIDAPTAEHRQLIDRHIAWMTALRYQLREPRAWETSSLAYNVEYRKRTFAVAEHQSPLEAASRLTEYRQVELTRLLGQLYDHQGKAERIKNFPYPRQFATLNALFIWLFIALLPLGILSEFQKLGGAWGWLAIPLTLLIAWVFHTMDKIGSASENPFEGGPNDVPITAMSRGIEIDLRDMAHESPLPTPHPPMGNILM